MNLPPTTSIPDLARQLDADGLHAELKGIAFSVKTDLYCLAATTFYNSLSHVPILGRIIDLIDKGLGVDLDSNKTIMLDTLLEEIETAAECVREFEIALGGADNNQGNVFLRAQAVQVRIYLEFIADGIKRAIERLDESEGKSITVH